MVLPRRPPPRHCAECCLRRIRKSRAMADGEAALAEARSCGAARLKVAELRSWCQECSTQIEPGDEVYPIEGVTPGLKRSSLCWLHLACAQRLGPPPVPPCKHFLRSGSCHYGSSCFFAHPEEAGRLGLERQLLRKERPGQKVANRGEGRRNKVKNCSKASVLRRWMLDAFGAGLLREGPVLDVAGGKGELAWELLNLNLAPAAVLDPRPLDLTSCEKKWRAGIFWRNPIFRSGLHCRCDSTEAPQSPKHLRLVLTERLLQWLAEGSPEDVEALAECKQRAMDLRWTRKGLVHEDGEAAEPADEPDEPVGEDADAELPETCGESAEEVLSIVRSCSVAARLWLQRARQALLGKERMSKPSPSLVHGALILAQVMFGGGAVVGKLGVARFNPLLFALIREAVAGPLLLLLALACDGWLMPRREDLRLLLAMGACVFSNQAFFIVGTKLAGPIVASAWQCSQPIFTLLISLSLGWEVATARKTWGILASFAGGAFLVCYGQPVSSPASSGNLLLALNCLGTSLYVIFGKFALQRYPSLSTTAWSYLFATAMMTATALCLNSNCAFIHFLCPESGHDDLACGSYRTSCSPWSVPQSAVLPLVYWVLFNSMGAYLLITWANQHARAGFVLAYTALQPLTSTTLSVLLIWTFGPSDLKLPGWNALGGIGILAGLVLVIADGKHQHEEDEMLEAANPDPAETETIGHSNGS
ncbi:unnamed protein product [Effrenium voratum]|nr:unnamed protein product [Effrenium voratum]